MKKKKILQIIPCFQYGGTEAYVINNFKNIDKNKFEFDFWIAQKSNSQYISNEYIKEIEDLNANIYFGETLDSKIKFMKSLYKHIQKNGPYDGVHVHMNIANAWSLIVAFLSGIKIRISHSHDTTGKEYKNLNRRIYVIFLNYIIKFFSTKKLACSKEAGNYLYGESCFSKKGKVCNNGIDVDKFVNTDKNMVNILRKEFNISEDSFVIGNITRFDSKKNPDFTVKVFYEILKIKPNSTLILGGVDGGKLSSIKEKVSKLGIQNKVRFIGVRNDINICLQLMDAYIFPSLFEGLGIVLLEAQASNIMCFASYGVSKEANLGLNLVHYLDLNKGEKYWAEYILNNYNIAKYNDDIIYNTFYEKGYSIKSSVRNIEKIYNGE